MTISEWQTEVHELAVEKGWYSTERSLGDMMTNIHSELSEAWEEFRAGRGMTETYYEGPEAKPCGFAVEMADTVIRILDLCEHFGIDLQRYIQMKHEFNMTRPQRHGGKKA